MQGLPIPSQLHTDVSEQGQGVWALWLTDNLFSFSITTHSQVIFGIQRNGIALPCWLYCVTLWLKGLHTGGP